MNKSKTEGKKSLNASVRFWRLNILQGFILAHGQNSKVRGGDDSGPDCDRSSLFTRCACPAAEASADALSDVASPIEDRGCSL